MRIILLLAIVSSLSIPMVDKRQDVQDQQKPGRQPQELSLYQSMRTTSAIMFAAGGLIMLGFGTGKVSAVSKASVQMIGGAAAVGITAFLILPELIDLSLTLLTILVLIAAVGGVVIVKNGNQKLGNFGLGFLSGLIIAIILAQFAEPLLSNNLSRLVYFGLFTLGGAALVMNDPNDRLLISSTLFVGSFGLVYGLDYLIFRSGFSNMPTVAFRGGSFDFDRDTSIAFIFFILLFSGCLFMQKQKIFK